VPGIGKKTAERLIVEMRDRFQKNTPPSSLPQAEPSFAHDALRALINLGYQPLQAQKAVQAALKEKDPAASSEDLGKFISLALRKM
jgi:Holliday junction DNA helicase RuvA